MKREHLGWFVAAVVVVVMAATGAAGPESQIGRFQIAGGVTQVVGKGDVPGGTKTTDLPVCLLLDTSTGKTWALAIQTYSADEPTMQWVPFDGAGPE